MILNKLFLFYFALYITTPFFNNAVLKIFGVNLTLILSGCGVMLFFPALLYSLWQNVKINKHLLCFFLLITAFYLFVSINQQYNMVKYLKPLYGGFLIVLFILCGGYVNEIFFNRVVLFISLAGVLLCLGDISTVMLAISTHSRMIFNANPISISALSAIGIIATAGSLFNKRLCFFIYGFFLFVLFIMLSRGAVIALTVVCLYYFLTKGYFVKILVVLTAVGTGGLILFIIRGAQNVSHRIDLYKLGFDLFSDNLFFGGGVGSFEALTTGAYPHNMVLELFCELGAVFTLFFLVVMILSFFHAAFKKKVDSMILISLLLFTMLQFSFSTINFLDILIPLSAIAFFQTRISQDVVQ